MTYWWRTRWFWVSFWRLNHLRGEPYGVRLMWKPRPSPTLPRYAEIPYAWDLEIYWQTPSGGHRFGRFYIG